MRRTLPVIVLLGMALPFSNKPVHVDDANFLAMARHAAVDPWRPHDFLINWQGTTEPAFDVLSNPPGIAWWLAPVANGSIISMHLWMLPWLILAGWGAQKLGNAVAGRPHSAALLLCGAPIAMIATQALTPDLPLLACVLAGMAGLLHKGSKDWSNKWPWALLLGVGAVFRYSGAAMIPLVGLWPWMHGERRAAIQLMAVASLPLALLMLHDVFAYESIHILAMTGFQSVSNTPGDIGHKAVASVAALGGAAVLPILCWNHPKRAILGLVVGAMIGALAADLVGQLPAPSLATILFSAAGGATLSAVIRPKDRLDQFLLAWCAIGLVFLISLRFSASRYWIPFFAPLVLIPLRYAAKPLILAASILTLLLGFALSMDDLDLAHTQQRAAEKAMLHPAERFAGHWGFQHHLETNGWTPVEDDELLGKQELVAISRNAWPQSTSNTCWEWMEVTPFSDPRPGLRVLTYAGGANLHGNMLSGIPPARVFAPWSVANDAMEHLTIRRACP
ncbi:MAG: hypothetical protein ACPGTU_01475 [Myxococcota bacterium]